MGGGNGGQGQAKIYLENIHGQGTVHLRMLMLVQEERIERGHDHRMFTQSVFHVSDLVRSGRERKGGHILLNNKWMTLV